MEQCYSLKDGHLRIIKDGQLLEDPLLSLRVGGVEGGMLGIAVDPKYSKNNYIYLYYTYNEFLSTSNKLVRYQLSDEILMEDKVLLEGIPGGPFHDGGRIQFGPDGKLYVTTGEAGNPGLSQDLNSLGGKILRINSDGTIPKDNPWDNSPIYSIGHRNPQGIDWDINGNMVSTEHGPSGLRGIAHDEINVITPGTNYGWPDMIGDETSKDLQNPIFHTGEDTWAPSGAEFYNGDKFPDWKGKYFVATLKGSHLHIIDFDLQNNVILSEEKLFQDEFGRLRDVQTGPDGFLYILTSNQDGRGTPKINDDRILKIMPLNYGIDNFEKCIADNNPIIESQPRQCTSKNGEKFVESILKIPNWIKENAKWWSLNQISDDDFTTGLQYMIHQKIIVMENEMIYEEKSELNLPLWLRDNAGLWSKGLLSDDEFLKNIQWMIDNDFIKLYL